jgi:hypothetical protein
MDWTWGAYQKGLAMSRDTLSSGQASVASADDSAVAESGYGGDLGGGGARGAKVCCTCGRDVAGQKRFKDAQGRYWCPDCVEEDEQRKHPLPCADCQKEFIKKELLEYQGLQVCGVCHEKRVKAARREAARISAAAEEGLRQHARRRVWAIGVATAVGVLALFGVLWVVLFR